VVDVAESERACRAEFDGAHDNEEIFPANLVPSDTTAPFEFEDGEKMFTGRG
jgi:hypothetical protein